MAPHEAKDVAAHPDEGQGTFIDEGMTEVATPSDDRVRLGLAEAINTKWLASPGELSKMPDEELQQFVEHEGAACLKTIPRRQVKTMKGRKTKLDFKTNTARRSTSTREYKRCLRRTGRGARYVMDESWQMMGQEEVCEDKVPQRMADTDGDRGENPDVTKTAGTSRMSPSHKTKWLLQ